MRRLFGLQGALSACGLGAAQGVSPLGARWGRCGSTQLDSWEAQSKKKKDDGAADGGVRRVMLCRGRGFVGAAGAAGICASGLVGWRGGVCA